MSAHETKRMWGLGCVLALGVAWCAQGAVLYNQTFTGTDGGWYDRDPGVDWDTAYDGGAGNPAGSLSGLFYDQDTPAPETDAWRRDNSTPSPLMGNMTVLYPAMTAWRFSFYADDVLPSDLTLRFGDGLNTFSRVLGSQVTSVGSWFTVTVPITYSGWFGGTSGDFASALAGVTFIDVQVTRNGSSQQTYHMDNFSIIDDVLSGGGGGAVPEPATGLFWFGAMLLYGLRRHMRGPQSVPA